MHGRHLSFETRLLRRDIKEVLHMTQALIDAVTRLSGDVKNEIDALNAARATGDLSGEAAAVANLNALSDQLEASVKTGGTPTPPAGNALTLDLSGIPTSGTVGASFSGVASSSGGVAPVRFDITLQGAGDPGLAIAGPQIIGIPTVAGSDVFNVTATDSAGTVTSGSVSVVISAAS